MDRHTIRNRLLLAVFFAGSAVAYPHLPDTIPMHFGADGRADAWEARSPGSWFALPLIATAAWLVVEMAVRAAGRNPTLWNMPDKARFLALPPEQQAPIARRMANFARWIGTMVIAVMMLVQAMIFAVSTAQARVMAGIPIAGIVLMVVATLAAALRMSRRTSAEVRRAR